MTKANGSTIRDRIVELRRVPASELMADPRNWRRHPDAQARALRSVLQSVGYADALLARETDEGLVLIDGHLRAGLDGDQVVPVLVLDVDETEAATILATLDPLSAMAEGDPEALERLLGESAITDEDLLQAVSGYLRKGPKDGLTDPDAVPEPPEPMTKPGDLWLLGEHRVLCGDATVPEDVARLRNGQDAAMVLTDPPFAIYGSSTGVASDIADDKMVRPFFEAMFRVIADAVPWFAHIYVHCDWRSWAAVWEGAKRAKLTPKNCLVWDKGSSGLGNNYANTHEFVGYFAKLPPHGTMTSGRRSGQRAVLHPNVLRFPRVSGEERQHNAAKPVAMLAELIVNSSDEGALVFDPFLGSGSTLIAAEKTERACIATEIEPSWCDVAVRRWEDFTGEKAERG